MKKGTATKGVGGKRIARVNVSMSNEYEAKLKKLAIACDMRPTTLANLILELSLDSSSVIKHLQDRFNKNEHYRVIPIHVNNKVMY